MIVRSGIFFRSSVLILALVLCGAAAGRGATLSERAAAIDAPARGAEVPLAGPLKVGRAEIVPAEGTRVRTLMAGGVPCGLVFEGPAQLRYRVEDPGRHLPHQGVLYRAGWGTTRAALVQELDTLTGGDWQPWFERYIYGTEIPKLPR